MIQWNLVHVRFKVEPLAQPVDRIVQLGLRTNGWHTDKDLKVIMTQVTKFHFFSKVFAHSQILYSGGQSNPTARPDYVALRPASKR